MGLWTLLSELSARWPLIGGALGAVGALWRGRRCGWCWIRSSRRWLARRWNVEVDNQQLQLEIERLGEELKLERLKNSTHDQISAVLRAQVAHLESLVASSAGSADATPRRRATDLPALPPSVPPTS